MLGVDPTFMLLQFKHLNKKLQNSDGFNLTECLQAWENMYVCAEACQNQWHQCKERSSRI